MDIFDQLANEDLSSVDTSYPKLKPGTYEFLISAITKETSERTGGTYLALTLNLVSEDGETPEGKPVPAGYVINHNISLTPTEKFDADAVKRNLCMFLDALETGRQWDETLDLYKGKTLWAKTKIQPERVDEATGDTYDARSAISRFLPHGA